MNIDDYDFHDSTILQVTENTFDQTIDFLLDFPVDWKNDLFKKKILRFKDVITYSKNEIPFAGYPSILSINNFGSIINNFGTGRNAFEVSRQKIEILTNAGNQIIQFSECLLLDFESK